MRNAISRILARFSRRDLCSRSVSWQKRYPTKPRKMHPFSGNAPAVARHDDDTEFSEPPRPLSQRTQGWNNPCGETPHSDIHIHTKALRARVMPAGACRTSKIYVFFLSLNRRTGTAFFESPYGLGKCCVGVWSMCSFHNIMCSFHNIMCSFHNIMWISEKFAQPA